MEEITGPFYGLEAEKSNKEYRVKLITKPRMIMTEIGPFPEISGIDVGLVDKITIQDFEGKCLDATENEFSVVGLIKKCRIVEEDGFTKLQCEGIKEKKKEVT